MATRPQTLTPEQHAAQLAQLHANGGIYSASVMPNRPAPLETLVITPENIATVTAAVEAATPAAVTVSATDKIYFIVEGYSPLVLNGVATQEFIDAISTVATEVYNLTNGTVYKSIKYAAIIALADNPLIVNPPEVKSYHLSLKPILANQLGSAADVRLMSQAEAVVRFGLTL